MKQRLEQPSLLGQEQSNPLSLGTFHALCAQLLYHHVDLTLLERNFVIADADRTKQLVKMVVKDLQPSLSNSGQRKKPGKKKKDSPLLFPMILILVLTETFCQSIRKAKNEGLDPLAYIAQCGSDPLTRDTAMIYR
jgi:superfamily I DNA/RNA helicase